MQKFNGEGRIVLKTNCSMAQLFDCSMARLLYRYLLLLPWGLAQGQQQCSMAQLLYCYIVKWLICSIVISFASPLGFSPGATTLLNGLNLPGYKIQNCHLPLVQYLYLCRRYGSFCRHTLGMEESRDNAEHHTS